MRKFLLYLLAKLPLPLLHLLASLLARLLYFLHSKQRYISDVNIRHCFPELSKQQQQQLSLASLIETTKTLLESFKLWLDKQEPVLALVKEVSGEELLTQALAKNQGVILLLPHLGNWELLGLYFASRYPITGMYRPQRSAFFDRLIYAGRARFGATMLPSGQEAVRGLLKALRHNELAWIMPDQNPGAGNGIFVPFFGVQANTPTLPARLAHKTHASVICAYAERLPFARGFHIHFSSTDPAIADEEMESATSCINRELENLIRRKPEQYWWSHNRFRHRPPGEAGMY